MYCGSFSNCEGSVAVGGNLYSGCYGYGFLGLIAGVPCQHILFHLSLKPSLVSSKIVLEYP